MQVGFAGQGHGGGLHMQVALGGLVVMAGQAAFAGNLAICTCAWPLQARQSWPRLGLGSSSPPGPAPLLRETRGAAHWRRPCLAEAALQQPWQTCKRRPCLESKCCGRAQKECVKQMHDAWDPGCALAGGWALFRLKKPFGQAGLCQATQCMCPLMQHRRFSIFPERQRCRSLITAQPQPPFFGRSVNAKKFRLQRYTSKGAGLCRQWWPKCLCRQWWPKCLCRQWCCLLRLAQCTPPALKPPGQQNSSCKRHSPSGLSCCL